MAILPVGFRISGLQNNGTAGGLVVFLHGAPMIPLEFTLPVAGPVTADLDCIPQACQEDNDNIRLVVAVVDEDGNPINLMTASSKQLLILTPQGTTIAKTASLLTSGVDGKLYYTTAAADLKEVGTYQVQAKFIIGGKLQTTRRAKFRVGENIED